MKKTKTKAAIIALILTLTIVTTIIALPAVNAQALIMNLPGDPYNVELHESIDIDLNGGPGPFQPIELWVKYPGRTDFPLQEHTLQGLMETLTYMTSTSTRQENFSLSGCLVQNPATLGL